MKYIIHKLGMIMVLLWSSLYVFAYDFEVDGIYYNVISPAKLTCGVNGISENADVSNEIIIPSSVSFAGKELTVTKILSKAFSDSQIRSISLPSSCVEICNSAFANCYLLEEITIPSSITKIGEQAFKGCKIINKVNISDLNAWCNIDFYIYYDSNPLSISKNAKLLLNGKLVTSINSNNTTNRIRNYAFSGYNFLTEVVIKDSTLYITDCAFTDCTNLKSAHIEVKRIPTNCFENCNKLESAHINTPTITQECFKNCTNLKSLYIGANVTKIGYCAFQGCSALADLYIADSSRKLYLNSDRKNNEETDFYHGLFYDCNLKHVYIGRDLIDQYAFSCGHSAIFDNQNVECMTIGPKVSEITSTYFNGDKASDSHSLPGKIQNIHNLVIIASPHYLICYPLDAINPHSLTLGRALYSTYDGSHAISNQWTNLTTLDIGEDVPSITDLELYNSKQLSSIVVRATTPPYCPDNTFCNDTYLFCTIKVPMGCLSKYQSTTGWNNFWNMEECDLTSSIIDGVADNKDTVSISAENGSIRVLGKDANKLVRVFTTQGTKIAETCEDMIPNLSHGVYIVTVGTKSFKVSL